MRSVAKPGLLRAVPSKTPDRTTNGQPKKKLRLVARAGEPTPLPVKPPRVTPIATPPLIERGRAELTLAQMAQKFPEASSVSEAQRTQLALIQGLLEPKSCFIAQFAASKGQLQVATVRGRNEARIKAVAPGEGPIGRAFSEGKIVREGNLVAIPLQADPALGCLVLLSCKHGASDELYAALAAQLTAAWEFARLRDDSARRNKDLQTAVAGLKSLEKNREDLLSNVSHDLKNPLTTIKAYLSMVLRAKLGDVTEKQQKALETCERNADRLLRMINDLLLISRLQSGKMDLNERPFGLKAVAEEIVQAAAPLAEQAKVRLTLLRCPEVFVRGDRERICEAVHNLVENAIHASAPQSEVVLSIGADESGQAIFAVKDHGPGLSEEEQRHLFEAYHRPKAGAGSRGLGLPIAAKIVHLHGGRIDITTKPDEGSTFQLCLPMFAGAVTPPPSTMQERRAGGILLVEDDADCREVVQQVLEQEGYRVLATSGAGEARAVLGHIKPGLVLLDLRLRDEDGRSVLQFIRETEALADVPVYIVSGSSEIGSLGNGQGVERIDGYFEKPLQLPKLLDTVAAVVRPSRKSPEPQA